MASSNDARGAFGILIPQPCGLPNCLISDNLVAILPNLSGRLMSPDCIIAKYARCFLMFLAVLD